MHLGLVYMNYFRRTKLIQILSISRRLVEGWFRRQMRESSAFIWTAANLKKKNTWNQGKRAAKPNQNGEIYRSVIAAENVQMNWQRWKELRPLMPLTLQVVSMKRFLAPRWKIHFVEQLVQVIRRVKVFAEKFFLVSTWSSSSTRW